MKTIVVDLIRREDTMLTTDFFQIAHTAKKIIPGVKDIPGVIKNEKDGTLKRWVDLDSETQAKVRDKIMYHVYIATFVHEFGHNLDSVIISKVI